MPKAESILSTRVANFMKLEAPDVPFRFDLGADVPLPMVHAKRNKELHGKWSKGHPDLFIMKCKKKYGGLYLELKATDDLVDSEHTRNQASYHAILRKNGYKCTFCFKYEDCIKKIKKYLKLK